MNQPEHKNVTQPAKTEKKRAGLKNEGGFECYRFVVIKVFQERTGIKSLHLHFQIGNVMSELDLRAPFRVKREKKTPVKSNSPA